MPEDDADWLNQTREELAMSRCAYWMSLEGKSESPNVSTVTVHVPVSQTFDSAQLRDMMNRVDRGEDV